jgi:hypothetical protein
MNDKRKPMVGRYRQITEGYQPGSQLHYNGPPPEEWDTSPLPPRGGSSVSKPAAARESAQTNGPVTLPSDRA